MAAEASLAQGEIQQIQTDHGPPSTIPKKNDHPGVCQEGCQIGKETRTTSYVTCSLCSHEFHCNCVGLTDKPASWTCQQCRLLPAVVYELKSLLSVLISKNEALTETVTQLQNSLKPLQTIENRLTAMHCKMFPDADDSEEEDDDDPEVEPSGTLLIGDSLLRDVAATDDSLTVDCTGGAHISNIRRKLRSVNPRKQKYETVVLVIGTNDASTKRPSEKICSDFKSLLSVAKSIATNVVLSSVPPRDDAKVDPGKIDNLNQLLVPLCGEVGVRFVNHDINFLYRDNSVDSNLLLADKLHLSAAGVSKLLQNLGLSGKAKVCVGNRPTAQLNHPAPSTNRSRSPVAPLMQIPTTAPPTSTPVNPVNPVLFHGARSPLSNFFPCSLQIWNMNFRSSEHAFQYRKCAFMGENASARDVLKAEMAAQAKKIGDGVGTSQNWQDTQQGTMSDILKAKARQCPQFVRALMNSNGRPLIEDTPNPFWGRGSGGNGLNMLGRLLMTLRAEMSANSFTPYPTNQPPRNHLGRTNPHSPAQQLRCFNCGEASHTVDTCGLPQPLRCYGCGGSGHKRKFCTKTRHTTH